MTIDGQRHSYVRPDARQWVGPDRGCDPFPFHCSFPEYHPTPLISLPPLAEELEVAAVFVKDESDRLGLPAFKVLGASWAVNRALCDRFGLDPASSLAELQHRALEHHELVLVTATDGNHGRAIARLARLLDLGARIYVPAGLSPQALDGIRDEGAQIIETGGTYDNVVEQAAASTEGNDHEVLVQDTSWPGYVDIPHWIVEGYSTLFAEVDQQLADLGLKADAVAIPTGVGSLLQSAVEHFRSADRTSRPGVIAVEPVSAACITASLQSGVPVTVDTSVATIMAGLNCGTPSLIAWPTIHAGVDAAQSVTEDDDLDALRRLNRLGVTVGPCGAASLAGTQQLLADPRRRQALGITTSSVLVLISTEGIDANPVTL